MLKTLSPPDKWLPVSIAPFGVDLEVCVMERANVHALAFPCRRTVAGWADTTSSRLLDIEPTHWRQWAETP